MLKKIRFKISNLRSQNDKELIESEIDVLNGVKDINVDYPSGEVILEFDKDKNSQNKIILLIKKLGYKVSDIQHMPSPREHTYFVRGMHCASCEILIEKKLLNLKGIKSVEASISKGEVLVEYEGEKISPEKLNKIFKKENYVFSDQPIKINEKLGIKKVLVVLGIVLILIWGFIAINKSGLTGLVSVNSKSSLPTFFILGLIAGISSCAALVGGIVLSLSKQWLEMYSEEESTLAKLQPHLMFNTGRIISYTLLGMLLGILGSKLQISLTFTSVLIIVTSFLMILLALQMLGVKYLRHFQLTVPKFLTRYITDETRLQSRYMPFLMGALTFFLPCGFTITAQGMALISGSFFQGGLIMLSFVLGTTPMLLLIGLSSIKLFQKLDLSSISLKVAGILVLFFALFNINSQLNVLGLKSFTDFDKKSTQPSQNVEEGLAPIVDGKQILKMDAYSYGYEPDYFKVRIGIPVRWEITDKGTSGCTNAVISQGLFDGEISLTPGEVSIKEFTPEKSGKYKFSCWMGMISGVIEVVDTSDNTNSSITSLNKLGTNNDAIVPSGARGCSCGGGGNTCVQR